MLGVPQNIDTIKLVKLNCISQVQQADWKKQWN